MKILRIIADLNPCSGGPVEFLLRSATILERRGHTAEAVCLDTPEAPWLSAYPFAVHAMGPATGRYGYTPRLAPWLKAHRQDYDAAVIEGLWNYASFGAWRGLAGGPIPYLLYPHGMMDPWFGKAQPLKHLAKQAFWLAFEGRVVRDAHAVLFTTAEECRLARTAFRGFGGYTERVVSYGTADVPADTAAHRAAWERAMPGLTGRRFLLFLSRIHPKKGCDLLISAFAKIAARHPDLDLVIAGPDQIGWGTTLRQQAEALGIAGRIHWPGMLSGDIKWGAFRAAHAFVLPSHQENFGIVVAEAMACGTPALITDQVNIWREVQASDGGLVAHDDLAGIESLLEQFLATDDDRKARMGRNARQCFLDHFEIESAADTLLEALEQACNDYSER